VLALGSSNKQAPWIPVWNMQTQGHVWEQHPRPDPYLDAECHKKGQPAPRLLRQESYAAAQADRPRLAPKV
jgi:hypothetical protein